MDHHAQALLANAAVVIIVLQIWISARGLAQKLEPVSSKVLFGLLFGLGSVFVMSVPISIADGIYFDLRMTLTGLCALIGGPLSGAIATLIAMGFRLHEGGAGLIGGMVLLASSLAIGLGFRLMRKRASLQPRNMAGFALVLTFASVVSMGALPREVIGQITPVLWLSLPLAVFLCTLLAGMMMAQELRWRRVQRVNDIYRRAIDTLADCLNVKDLGGRFLVANPATAALMRAPSVSALITRTDFDFYPEDVAAMYRREETEVMMRGEASAFEQRYRHRDGSEGWLATLKAPLRDSSGTIIGLISHNRDITGQKAIEAKLAETQRHFSEALANMADGLVMFDSDGRMVFCNEQYRTMFPKTMDLRQPGSSFRAILEASVARGEQAAVDPAFASQWMQRFLAMLTKPASNQFVLDDGRWIEARSRPGPDGSALIVYADITEMKRRERELKALNAELARLASTDGLSGLLNRRAFDAALVSQATVACALGEELCVLLTDIDHFKAFNDTYGHPAGDLVIRAVAECLAETFSGENTVVGRYGGEEFGVVVRGRTHDDMLGAAHDFRRAVEARGISHIASSTGHVTVSAGFACSRTLSDAGASAELLLHADKALYAAKGAGRNGVRGQVIVHGAARAG